MLDTATQSRLSAEDLGDEIALLAAQIDAMTAFPRWDGEAVDYEYVGAVMQQSGVV